VLPRVIRLNQISNATWIIEWFDEPAILSFRSISGFLLLKGLYFLVIPFFLHGKCSDWVKCKR